jgi:hypothetical protein
MSLTPQRILELYEMRWAIEVYFKEALQHLGFLQEQSNHYAAYVSSIYLTAIHFYILVIGKTQEYSDGISSVRNQIIANATAIDHATRLWQVFHAVIAGALDEIKVELGDMFDRVTNLSPTFRPVDLGVEELASPPLRLTLQGGVVCAPA